MTPSQRAAALLGSASGHGWVSRLARGLGISRRAIYRWDDAWPDYALASLELLEMTPRDRWPQRWA